MSKAKENETEDPRGFDAESLRINPMDLNTEFVELPPRLAYWNQRLADATESAMEAKAIRDREEARGLLSVKEKARLKGDKLTVDEVRAAVAGKEDVQEAQDLYIVKEAERFRLKGIVDAIIAKKDMLQSLGAKVRAEMMADPSIREMFSSGTALDFGGSQD